MVKVGDAKEQGRDQDCDTRPECLDQQGHHAGTESELFGQRSHDVVPDPGKVTDISTPISGICRKLIIQSSSRLGLGVLYSYSPMYLRHRPVTICPLIGPKKSIIVSRRGTIVAIRQPSRLNPKAVDREISAVNAPEDIRYGNKGEMGIITKTLRNRFLMTSGWFLKAGN